MAARPVIDGRLRPGDLTRILLASALVVVLVLPLVVLATSSSPGELAAGIRHPAFGPALALSLRTTIVSLAFVVVTGTPLAWWLAASDSRLARVVRVVVDLPIVIPPAVVGVALLATYGRHGWLGPSLEALGLSIPFSTTAVVIAQVVVAAPFFVQASTEAFRRVDPDLLLVARTLGASSSESFVRIAIPIALPGLVGGAALAWARALGEFGATLLFAGNLTGRTQTLPLAIYTALESDVAVALAIALVLGAIAVVLLIALRYGPRAIAHWRGLDAASDREPV